MERAKPFKILNPIEAEDHYPSILDSVLSKEIMASLRVPVVPFTYVLSQGGDF